MKTNLNHIGLDAKKSEKPATTKPTSILHECTRYTLEHEGRKVF